MWKQTRRPVPGPAVLGGGGLVDEHAVGVLRDQALLLQFWEWEGCLGFGSRRRRRSGGSAALRLCCSAALQWSVWSVLESVECVGVCGVCWSLWTWWWCGVVV